MNYIYIIIYIKFDKREVFIIFFNFYILPLNYCVFNFLFICYLVSQKFQSKMYNFYNLLGELFIVLYLLYISVETLVDFIIIKI